MVENQMEGNQINIIFPSLPFPSVLLSLVYLLFPFPFQN